jgi:hypothetical protein
MNISVGGGMLVKYWLAHYVSLGDTRNFILKTNYKDICTTIYCVFVLLQVGAVCMYSVNIDKMLIILI